jgi:predicted anti-sigma-YlaC factor YlaD
MTAHELVRPLLALSAAGLLDAEGERRLREHAAGCAACRAELELFAQLAAGLRDLPVAPPPPGLLARTQALVAADADRREGARLAAAAAVFAAILLLSLAVVLPVLAWFVWTIIPSVLGGAAAIALASHRRLERSIL